MVSLLFVHTFVTWFASNTNFMGFFQANIWQKLRRFHKNVKYPECVEHLMVRAGYDSILSLSQINENKVAEIENFLNTNRQIISELKCCHTAWYQNMENFIFLPGHKSIILSLPDQIKAMTEKTMEKTNPISKSKRNKVQSDEELINHLVSNLQEFTKNQAEKAGFEMTTEVISPINIHHFERTSNTDSFVAKCRFSCPFCSKSYAVAYKKFWMSSNVTTHLKMHICAIQKK